MSPRNLPSAAARPKQPAVAANRMKARARRRKGNSHTELTRSELEQMVLEAARMRAVQARSRSGA